MNLRETVTMNSKFNQTDLKSLLYKMLLIRRFEERIVQLYPKQEMKTPVHLYIGQEAVAAGVCHALDTRDHVFSTHRSHGHYLAKGGSVKHLAAELYGRKTGCSSGKGGSMHIIDLSCGVSGTTAIVGGGIPLATGAALASSIRNDGKVSVSFFGDGAADEGTFFESMGFAALKKLPIIFVIENNFFATSSPLSSRRSHNELYKLGESHGIPSVRVAGNDVTTVLEAARLAVKRARKGLGPSLIEAVTYRWKGHVGIEDTKDLPSSIHREMQQCPIALFQECVLKHLSYGPTLMKEVEGKVFQEVGAAFNFAKSSPAPDIETTYTNVW
ncbi:thiamine pyrophosphate-dependent dehydrogenase E1 component subunit alpha [uncultured Desulfobacter sp.]|uniref:thiamine pyrophosphate-dependent dehydrogenase E1 component subunit alpha n=1 Tax=uncultured Desulfobacter sp. TaxID=240139 RepID=UPI0029F58A25|nr:thiamine pyrophosphate-dependent dehydrogenase E1 component subunit alpha [uncultured Desulfobacter sp.]